jgi:hypothetical protein
MKPSFVAWLEHFEGLGVTHYNLTETGNVISKSFALYVRHIVPHWAVDISDVVARQTKPLRDLISKRPFVKSRRVRAGPAARDKNIAIGTKAKGSTLSVLEKFCQA